MKNKKKSRKCRRPESHSIAKKKIVYDFIGISPEVLMNEPKIVITGDYLVEFYNHRGLIDISDTQIKINAKKAIYKITGCGLFICGITDDEVDISGKLISIEREV